MSENLIDLKEVQNLSLEIISACRDALDEQFRTPDLFDCSSVHEVTFKLMSFASGRSQCISFLLSNGFLFDSEIIVRSFYEAIFKVVFILVHPSKKPEELAKEFLGDFAEATMQGVKHRAAFSLSLARSMGTKNDQDIFDRLANDDISVTSNKAERRRLKQRWSFSEIAAVISQNVDGSKAILHGYGMMSSICHADPVGLMLIEDDATRPGIEGQLRHASQAIRVMSDQAFLWYLATYYVSNYTQTELKTELFDDLFKRFNVASEPVSAQFHSSQNGFYSR